jgi:hypothetical protein
MATCARCFGHLHEQHRCRGVVAKQFRQVGSVTVTSAALGFGGAFMAVEQPSVPLLVVAISLASTIVAAVARELSLRLP